LNLVFDNVNLKSNSGPNSFASKLQKYATKAGHTINKAGDIDAYLCFIESPRAKYNKPMFQRLDGIYFNSAFDYKKQNENIKRTYDMADGVIFQSEFNKKLTSHYFGLHPNHIVIHNGADMETIDNTPALEFNRYESLWSCASSWRPHKRLDENIRYFLEHSSPYDGLMIAGDVPFDQRVKEDRIHYVGVLNQKQLFALYKRTERFLHLAWLDHCPNVVVDARACGCQVICSSAGGTREIAGPNAIIVEEDEWNLEPIELYSPPKLNFQKKLDNVKETCYNINMPYVAKQYIDFMSE